MKLFRNNNGFSMLEIIAVLFVISMGLIGPLSLIIQNIQIQYINKNNLIASQLAQEGLELVRKKRDDNWLDTNAFYIDIATVDANKTFTIDSEGIIDVVDINDSGAILKVDNYYSHSLGDNSIFSRIVKTSMSDDESSITITCTVLWTERNQKHEHEVNTVLYDWR